MRPILRAAAIILVSSFVVFLSPWLPGFPGEEQVMIKALSGNEQYRDLWKKVETAMSEGKPRTALDIVETIYQKAKAEKEETEFIKAVAYRVALRAETNEEGEITLIADLEKEVRDARGPVRAVLQSYLAQTYWNHYQSNRWEIGQRTRVDNTPDADFRTWDAAKFIDTVRVLYFASIADAPALQAVPIAKYKGILRAETEKSEYRPTMFDVLAHRALDFFQNDETDLPRPQREFEIATLDALAPAAVFVKHPFTAPDENDQQYVTVRLYQELLRFHLNDVSSDALLDADLARLDFARKATLHEDADTVYYRELERLHGVHLAGAMGSEVRYRMALYKESQGDLVAAMSICDEVLGKNAGSRGAVNCQSLKDRILVKELHCAVEQTTLPEQPFILPVTYRNLDRVYFRLVAMDEEDWRDWVSYRRNMEDRLRDVVAKRPLRAWDSQLPDLKDFKSHTADVKGPAMPFGHYLLLCSHAKNFSLEKNAISYTELTVTRLSLQSQDLENGGIRFWVRDAENGTPQADVRVTMASQEWNSTRQQYERVRGRDARTDAQGMFEMAPESSRDYVFVTLRKGQDVYDVDRQFYSYRRGRSEEHTRTMFFTDRSLYRPGQTIYFKGIVLKQDPANAKFRVEPKYRSTVRFFDVNNQKIAEQTFTTNEYGSFNGVFTAPAGVLTGLMHIRNENGAVSVRVEEYKRPKFEVTFDPLKGEAALGEKVTVKGGAKAYAGSNIDNADVVWRVFRRVRFPYWWWWWRPAPGGADKEIAHGTAKTNDAGEFSIEFEAVPDKTVDRKDLPVFTYTISADVTDINGETRSATTSVSLGYTTIELTTNVPEYADRGGDIRLPVHAANLNGQPLKTTGNAVFERLRVPDRVFRARILPAADVQIMDAAEYHRAFPHDPYKDEAREDTWAVEETPFNTRFSTDEKGNDTLELRRFPAGRYRMTLTAKDPSGETITVKRFFTVFDGKEKRPPVADAALFIPLKLDAQPGEEASFLFGTSYPDAHVLYQVEHRGEIVKQEWLDMDNETRRFSIPITEEHRGGLSVRFSIVNAYRHESIERTISVPWTNKQLSIETSTFRDKLRPGDKEEWRITLKGEKAGEVAAEMLAAMYDASLDAIYPHGWQYFTWPGFYAVSTLVPSGFGVESAQQYSNDWNQVRSGYYVSYPDLNLFLLDRGWGYRYGRRYRSMRKNGGADDMADGEVMMAMEAAPAPAAQAAMASKAMVGGVERDEKKDKNEVGSGAPPPPPPAGGKGDDGLGQVKARTNFNETAFFFPALMTNEKGEYVLSFTIPEALTRWRLMAFAHTPDMKVGYFEHRSVTQKELMVVPNAPRFFREGDELVFPVKISNISDTALAGTAKLQLFDAVTMKPLDANFGLADALRPFKMDKGTSASVSWALKIPEGLTAIVYRVVAKAGAFSDGEEAPLPVLPNRMLVTESLPLNVRGNQTRTYVFDKLVNSGISKTLRHQKLTLEMTSNPAWYAVQALPYIMEYPYECAEQLFNRYYANSIAAHIVRSNPKIERVFNQWKGTDALVSNLEKNQELKSLLIQETPWVMQGQNEGERKRRIALLFDLNGMANTLDAALRKLEKAQNANGGFPWFPGMPESRYITQYIIAGLGHLRELGVDVSEPRIAQLLQRAVAWADAEMHHEYELMRKRRDFNPDLDHLSYVEIQYLYARGYFLKQDIAKEHKAAADFWLKQAKKYWLKKGLMSEGMLSLALHRFSEKKTAQAIAASLKERAMFNDELGMYWKQNGGWFWWQAPIETQALLVEVFDVVADDENAVEEMKIWLLKQKQVQDWKTTVATAEACYALLRRGTDLLASDKLVEVKMGGTLVDPRGPEGKAPEAGTGYYKVSWNAGEIQPKQGNVVVTKSDKGIAWGAVYWQYFEQLDKITPAQTPLKIEKELYRQANTDKGVTLEPITSKNPLRVGDVLKARIVIRVDRDMEYVHLKDMRGAGFELMNQLSRYRWQAGFGYYEAPKDASVNFFIYWLPKGVHVFEYPLRVSHQGTFSNGISTIQSMYAPEFAAHTQGFTVTVKP